MQELGNDKLWAFANGKKPKHCWDSRFLSFGVNQFINTIAKCRSESDLVPWPHTTKPILKVVSQQAIIIHVAKSPTY